MDDEERKGLIPSCERNVGYGGIELPQDEHEFHCHTERGSRNSPDRRARRVLAIALFVCFAFMIAEVIGGALANSLAIMTDAAHLLTDFASMLISLFSLYIAAKPASQKMSFGWHRAEVVGAFFSVFLIWIVTGVLVFTAVHRIIKGEHEVDAVIMAITASIGLLVNIVMGALLYFGGHSHSHGPSRAAHAHAHGGEHGHAHGGGRNINVRAAFIHVIGDFVQSIGVLIAAILILFKSEWAILDPICTLLFSVIVLFTTIYVTRDAMVVLLEGRPASIDFRTVFDSLEKIDGVKKVHDLRIWALTMDKVAISVHLETDVDANSKLILRNTTLMLRNDFNVHESTVQIEGYSPTTDDCHQCIPPR